MQNVIGSWWYALTPETRLCRWVLWQTIILPTLSTACWWGDQMWHFVIWHPIAMIASPTSQGEPQIVMACEAEGLMCEDMSEYNPVHQTPCFSNASPKHLWSSSVYSDTLHIRLHMLCNSAPPPGSTPLLVPPPLVCLFVCLFPLPDCFC